MKTPVMTYIINTLGEVKIEKQLSLLFYRTQKLLPKRKKFTTSTDFEGKPFFLLPQTLLYCSELIKMVEGRKASRRLHLSS
jgi:hypothetical protein